MPGTVHPPRHDTDTIPCGPLPFPSSDPPERAWKARKQPGPSQRCRGSTSGQAFTLAVRCELSDPEGPQGRKAALQIPVSVKANGEPSTYVCGGRIEHCRVEQVSTRCLQSAHLADSDVTSQAPVLCDDQRSGGRDGLHTFGQSGTSDVCHGSPNRSDHGFRTLVSKSARLQPSPQHGHDATVVTVGRYAKARIEAIELWRQVVNGTDGTARVAARIAHRPVSARPMSQVDRLSNRLRTQNAFCEIQTAARARGS